MKLSYHLPGDVQRLLEGDEEVQEVFLSLPCRAFGAAPPSATNAKAMGLKEVTEEEDTDTVELEINFDPPKTPIRITSPDQIPIAAGTRRNYTINTDTISRFLQLKNQELVRDGKEITQLSLNKICFLEADNEQWALATRDLPSLERITATTCTLDSNAWLVQLAHLPSLTVLELDHVSRPGSANSSLPSITNFLQHQKNTITKFVFNGLSHAYSDSEVRSFCQAVQECTSLEFFLCNVCSFQEDQVAFLADLLQHDTKLQEVEFDLGSLGSTALIAKSIAHNRKLRTFTLSNQQLFQQFDNIDECLKVLEAFRETLATQNVHLNDLNLKDLVFRLDDWGREYSELDKKKMMELRDHLMSINLYLHLNQLGRKRFLRGSSSSEEEISKSKDDWVQIVADNSGNLSVIFYFLQLNPSMYFD